MQNYNIPYNFPDLSPQQLRYSYYEAEAIVSIVPMNTIIQIPNNLINVSPLENILNNIQFLSHIQERN